MSNGSLDYLKQLKETLSELEENIKSVGTIWIYSLVANYLWLRDIVGRGEQTGYLYGSTMLMYYSMVAISLLGGLTIILYLFVKITEFWDILRNKNPN
jgi:hypothetical protein